MILLRDKNFTRAEKEMLKQAYRVTGGFRRLPGKGITSVEDAEALARLNNDFVQKLMHGSSVTISPEIRAALDRLGLTKVDEKTLNNLLTKYRDREAIKRVKDIGLIRKTNNPTNPNYARMTRKLIRRNHEGAEYQDKMVNELRSNHLFLSRAKGENSEPIIRFTRKKLGASTYRLPGNDTTGAQFIPNASKITGNEIGNLAKLEGPAQIQNDKHLYGSYYNAKPLLVVNPESKRFIALHEVGHYINKKKGLDNVRLGFDPNNSYVPGQFVTNLDNVGQIVEENMASARALEALKNQGKREQELSRIAANKALGTYMGGAKAASTKYKFEYPRS